MAALAAASAAARAARSAASLQAPSWAAAALCSASWEGSRPWMVVVWTRTMSPASWAAGSAMIQRIGSASS